MSPNGRKQRFTRLILGVIGAALGAVCTDWVHKHVRRAGPFGPNDIRCLGYPLTLDSLLGLGARDADIDPTSAELGFMSDPGSVAFLSAASAAVKPHVSDPRFRYETDFVALNDGCVRGWPFVSRNVATTIWVMRLGKDSRRLDTRYPIDIAVDGSNPICYWGLVEWH